MKTIDKIKDLFGIKNKSKSIEEFYENYDVSRKIDPATYTGGYTDSSSQYTPNQSNYALLKDGYGLSAWVNIITNRIADGVQKIPYQLVDLEGEPLKPFAKRQPKIQQLQGLLDTPQEEKGDLSFKDLIRTCVLNYLLTGTGYMNMIDDELIVPNTSRVTPDTVGNLFGKVQSYSVNYHNASWKALPNEMMTILDTNIIYDSVEGYSKIQALRNVWKANIALFQNEQLTHERRGVNALLFSKSNRVATDRERLIIQEAINKAMSNMSVSGQKYYSPVELGYIDLAKSFKDLEATESKDSHQKILASAFNYPVPLLNNTEGSTYNNTKEFDKKAFEKAVIPVADKFLESFNKTFVKNWFGIETAKLGYQRKDIPELTILEKEKVETDKIKLETLLTIQSSVNSGTTSYQSGINTLIYLGYTEQQANDLLIGNNNNNGTDRQDTQE